MSKVLPKNELLGHVTCPQGGRAEVRQTKKAGRHFYTSCECCGLNQGAGQARQQHIYDNAEFLQGVTVVRPSNVTETAKPVNDPEPVKPAEASEPESKGQLEPVGDFDPAATEPESNNAPASRGLVRFLPGVILLAAAGVGAWMA